MPFAAYFNPTALGDRGTLDLAIWTASHLFFDPAGEDTRKLEDGTLGGEVAISEIQRRRG